MRKPGITLFACLAFALLIAAGTEKPATTRQADSVQRSATITAGKPMPGKAAGTLRDKHEAVPADEPTTATAEVEQLPTTARATNYEIKWSSINGGGAIQASSTNHRMGLSVGQSVAGAASSSNYKVGIGFWFGTGGSAGTACAITATGDVNLTGTLTSADIIFLVNFVFKGGPTPSPCEAAGDVNCTGTVTSGDIIYLVNHVFKGGPAPCDVCTLIPAVWSCP